MLTAPTLEVAISEGLVRASTALIVDLSKVDFLASAGISVLLKGHQDAGSAERFAVVADGPMTSRPMKLMNLDQELSLYTTVESALEDVH